MINKVSAVSLKGNNSNHKKMTKVVPHPTGGLKTAHTDAFVKGCKK